MVAMRLRAGSAVLVVGALLLAGCSSAEPAAAPAPTPTPTATTATPTATPTPTPTPTSFAAAFATAQKRFLGQKLQWRECGTLRCANLRVPLDYANPGGDTILLQVVKRTTIATGERKLGSIVLNPGGPGGSGFDYVAGGSPVSDAIAERYDIIGFDPRGVQRSAPVECLTPQQTDAFYAFDGSPDGDAEATAAFLLGRQFALDCKRNDAALLPFLGTREASQDLEILRSALGDEKLNYLGKSYGTFLGAQYAQRFPATVGRMVLDGAIDPTQTADGYARGQATGFERALTAFIADCVKRSGCPLGRDADRARARLDAYLNSLDQRPQQVGDRQLTQALGTLGVIASFYSVNTWPRLRTALGQALRGNGKGMLDLADFYSQRSPDGRYPSNSLDAFYAIGCMDRSDVKDVQQTQALATQLTEQVSATFGAYLAWGNTPCQSWPLRSSLTPAPVTASGSAPIVVVGTTRDPATPYEWSQALAQQLENGVLVTRRGDGHTAYREGNGCIDRNIDGFLVRGIVPTDGTRC